MEVRCELAAERGLRVDMHCDETDDPMSRHVETLALETLRLGLEVTDDAALAEFEGRLASARGETRVHPYRPPHNESARRGAPPGCR